MLNILSCKYATSSSVFLCLTPDGVSKIAEYFSEACPISYGDANRTLVSIETFEDVLRRIELWEIIEDNWKKVKRDMDAADTRYIDLEN
jgi:hypothetical protein